MMKKHNLELKEQIENLKSEGYKKRQILEIMKISEVKYYYLTLSEKTREKRVKSIKIYLQKYYTQPYYYLIRKVKCFQSKAVCTKPFTYKDVLEKFGENPICYLTGRKIDLNDPSQYQLDHVIPINKGGLGNLDNLQISCAIANQMKRDYSLDEFIKACIEIADFQNKSRIF